MGHFNQIKGRVTEADIHVASILMDRMNLHGESRTAAQQAFRVGNLMIIRCVKKCASCARLFRRFDLIPDVSEIQLHDASPMANYIPNEREVLFVIADELGISRAQFEQFLRMMQGGAPVWRRFSARLLRPGRWKCRLAGRRSADPRWKMHATCWGEAYR